MRLLIHHITLLALNVLMRRLLLVGACYYCDHTYFILHNRESRCGEIISRIRRALHRMYYCLLTNCPMLLHHTQHRPPSNMTWIGTYITCKLSTLSKIYTSASHKSSCKDKFLKISASMAVTQALFMHGDTHIKYEIILSALPNFGYNPRLL